jgi:hypothetical protein
MNLEHLRAFSNRSDKSLNDLLREHIRVLDLGISGYSIIYQSELPFDPVLMVNDGVTSDNPLIGLSGWVDGAADSLYTPKADYLFKPTFAGDGFHYLPLAAYFHATLFADQACTSGVSSANFARWLPLPRAIQVGAVTTPTNELNGYEDSQAEIAKKLVLITRNPPLCYFRVAHDVTMTAGYDHTLYSSPLMNFNLWIKLRASFDVFDAQ